MNWTLSLFLAASLQAAPQPQEPPVKPPEPPPPAWIKQVTVGGQARFRAEYRNPLSYADTAAAIDDDDLFLSRLRLNVKFTPAENIDVFIQPQDQRTFGDETSVLSDETNLDLHQGYVELRELGAPGLSLKMGRQELSYGDQRLVSPLDWSNIARAWDGARLRYAPGDWWAEGFYTVIKEGTGAEDDQDFYGVYASTTALKDHEFDGYLFVREFNDNSQTGETLPAAVNDRRDRTAGARLKGRWEGLDYTGEGMIQRGTLGDDDIEAWAAAFTAGYTFDMEWKPRVGVEVTHASGDDDPADGDIGTFDPLYPFGHFYQGFADIFAFKNGRDAAVYLKVAPLETLSLHLDFHSFRLVEDRDAWYNFAGAAIRRDSTGKADPEVGREIDLHARLAVGKNVKFWAGWSRFFAGPFVEETPGREHDMDWLFLQMTVDF